MKSFKLVIGLSALITTEALAGTPAWVNGADPRYSTESYVIGVGKGPSQQAADIDARAEVSRVFESKVAAVMQDFQAAATAVNGAGKGVSIEVQEVASFQKVTTQKTLTGVELKERGKDGSTFYTLGLLDRTQCVNSLTEQIEALDQKITGALSRGEGADKLGAFKAYGAALNMMDEREALNAMLRICNKQGKGIPAPVEMGELAGKFEEASGNFKLGIDLQGSGAGRVRDCIMELLGNKGYQITEIEVDEEEEAEEEDEEGGGGFDAVLRGTLKSEPAGNVAGSVLVRTELVLKLVNGKTKKVLKTFRGNRKEGRKDIKSSAALSAYKICQMEAPKITEAIDQFFKR